VAPHLDVMLVGESYILMRVVRTKAGFACIQLHQSGALQQSQLRMGHLSVTNPSLVILPCGFFSPHPLF